MAKAIKIVVPLLLIAAFLTFETIAALHSSPNSCPPSSCPAGSYFPYDPHWEPHGDP
jgi:hypothetical protein